MKIEYMIVYFESFLEYPKIEFFNEMGLNGWIFCGRYPGFTSMPCPLSPNPEARFNQEQGLNFVFYRELKEPVNVPAN